MSLHAWAVQWGIPAVAMVDLQKRLGLDTTVLDPSAPGYGHGEAWVQSGVRLEASRQGIRAFRNNSGALKSEDGRLVRFGLGNDSKQTNELIKSGDLIGWRSFVIQIEHVGMKFAQFWSREVKHPGWHYGGDERERAQKRWADMVNADGGDAAFITDPGAV